MHTFSEITEKATDAVDYSDITEVADVEEPEKKGQRCSCNHETSRLG